MKTRFQPSPLAPKEQNEGDAEGEVAITFVLGHDGIWRWAWQRPEDVVLSPRQITQLRKTFDLAIRLRRAEWSGSEDTEV